MTDQAKKPSRRRPIANSPSEAKDEGRKAPRRYTLEELLAGMKPERSEFMKDDWPIGKELI